MIRSARAACLVVASSVVIAVAAVPQGASGQEPATTAAAPAPKVQAQGIAVVAIGPVRDEAFALARAVYGSRLRPSSLDEVRARVLAGGAPPASASRELRELAEVRAGIHGDDAAARRLLVGLAQQVGARALLVVAVDPRAPAPAVVSTGGGAAGAQVVDAGSSTSVSVGDAGASSADASANASANANAGVNASQLGNAPRETTVVARLLLADSGDFDAARYSPEDGLRGAAAWKSTIASLEARFPAAPARVVGPAAATSAAPAKMVPEKEKSSAFYSSAWFWRVAGAALLGGAFYVATRDTGSDPIHLQMTVPK